MIRRTAVLAGAIAILVGGSFVFGAFRTNDTAKTPRAVLSRVRAAAMLVRAKTASVTYLAAVATQVASAPVKAAVRPVAAQDRKSV